MKLIQDVIPPYQGDRTGDMVRELYNSGVTIEDIFGMYYAMDAQRAHYDQQMFGSSEEGLHGAQAGTRATMKVSVGDAQLVYGIRPVTYDQPF